MKQILTLRSCAAALAAAGLISSTPNAAAFLTAYEPFDYSAGSLLVGLTGGYGWNGPWRGAGGANNQVVAGSFVYNDGFGNVVTAAGNRAHVTGVGSLMDCLEGPAIRLVHLIVSYRIMGPVSEHYLD